MNIDTALISRVEVIDDEGRACTIRPTRAVLSVQDDGRTLKVFVKGRAHVRRAVATNGAGCDSTKASSAESAAQKG